MNVRLSKRSFWHMLPVIFALAWPTMLEEAMQTIVQYIDTAMVGSLGTQATAAVGATTTINWLLNTSISALGVGFLAFIAKAYGAGNQKLAHKAVSQVVLAVLCVGSLFTVLTLSLSSKIPVWMQVDESIRETAGRYFFILYIPMLPRTASILFGTVLRSVGDTKTPMRTGILVNSLNVILNFLFIYPTRRFHGILIPGLNLGVTGAAIASAIAFTVGGICITVALWRHPDISPKGHSIRPDWHVLQPCLKVALPNMLQRFGTSMGYVAFASMINSLGDVSTAAHTIANTVESAFYIPGYGMQTAAATLAGNAFGAKDQKKMVDLSKMMIVLELIMMSVSGGLLYLFAPNLMGLFSKSQEVILLGSAILRIVALSEPIYGISIAMEGMMQGVGKTVTPFIFNIIGMWGIRIIGTYLCTQIWGFGLISAWVCMVAHNFMLFVMFSVHFIRGKWNPLRD